MIQPILKVNLSTGETESFQVPEPWKNLFLGGASLAARLLYNHLKPDLDPLSPEAPLVFLNGPLSGTAGPAVGRFAICGRSPATGLWAESNCGGFWGVELRKAAYSGIWLTGQAPELSYLWIKDGGVEIRSAPHLAGLGTYEVQAAIEDELKCGKVRTAAIGPAGEALIPYALVLCDHGRVAGRTGMGCIMGAKRLKAIAVQGHGNIPLADPQRYTEIRSQANRALAADAVTQVLRELGTSSAADYFDYLREMPKRYFQRGALSEPLAVSGSAVKDTLLVGVSACHACVIACGRVVDLGRADGRLPAKKQKGAEYETLVGFGPNLGLNDPVFATRMSALCDHYGMDTISLSNTIGLAFYLFQEGQITLGDTEGLDLSWGNKDAVESLVHLAASRRGFGAYVAEGALALGRRFGAPEAAVQVNGLEAAYHDPRGASGMALVYATSPRGACHNQSDYFMVDIGGAEPSLGFRLHDRLGGAEKAASVAAHQNWRTLFNSLVMCFFANPPAETLLELILASTGLDWTLADMLKAGERGWNIKRALNCRLGLTSKNDQLPPALLQPYQDADPDDQYVPDLDSMLQAYYTAREWDPQTGRPSLGKLLSLELSDIAEDLWPQMIACQEK